MTLLICFIVKINIFSEIAYFYAIFFVFTGVAERSFGQVFRYDVVFRFYNPSCGNPKLLQILLCRPFKIGGDRI